MTATRLNCKDFGYGCPYPIGDVLMRQNDNSPANDWPGTTWSEIGQGRFPIGANSTYGNGSTGDPTHTHTTGNYTLKVADIPAHSHPSASSGKSFWTLKTASGTEGTFSVDRNGGGPMGYFPGSNRGYGYDSYNLTTGNTGGGGSHNHGVTGPATAIPPWFGVRFWKRTA